jgi:hypothetical protein
VSEHTYFFSSPLPSLELSESLLLLSLLLLDFSPSVPALGNTLDSKEENSNSAHLFPAVSLSSSLFPDSPSSLSDSFFSRSGTPGDTFRFVPIEMASFSGLGAFGVVP